jgi:hypothetical protein
MFFTLSPHFFFSGSCDSARDLPVEGLETLLLAVPGRMGEVTASMWSEVRRWKLRDVLLGWKGEQGLVQLVELVPGREKMDRRSVGGWELGRNMRDEEVWRRWKKLWCFLLKRS